LVGHFHFIGHWDADYLLKDMHRIKNMMEADITCAGKLLEW
jgi:hypothetical protein